MARARFNFQFDATKFKKKCNSLGKEFGVMGKAVLADQMRLWAIDALEHTYPGDNSKAAQDKGVKKLTGQIAKIIHGVSKSVFLALIAEQFGGKPRDARRAARRAVPEVVMNMEGNQIRLRDWHNAQRGKNDGNVKRGRKIVAYWGKDRIAIDAGMYAPSAAVNKFVKRKAAHVGILKGGWIKAIRKFADMAKKPPTSRDIPRWVAKARELDPVKSGTTGGDFREATLKGNMFMVHQVPWNEKLEAIVQRLGRTRQADLDNHLRTRMGQLARRFSAA